MIFLEVTTKGSGTDHNSNNKILLLYYVFLSFSLWFIISFGWAKNEHLANTGIDHLSFKCLKVQALQMCACCIVLILASLFSYEAIIKAMFHCLVSRQASKHLYSLKQNTNHTEKQIPLLSSLTSSHVYSSFSHCLATELAPQDSFFSYLSYFCLYSSHQFSHASEGLHQRTKTRKPILQNHKWEVNQKKVKIRSVKNLSYLNGIRMQLAIMSFHEICNQSNSLQRSFTSMSSLIAVKWLYGRTTNFPVNRSYEFQLQGIN